MAGELGRTGVDSFVSGPDIVALAGVANYSFAAAHQGRDPSVTESLAFERPESVRG